MNKIIHKLYSISPPIIQRFWKKIADSDIGSRIAKGAFWSLTGSIFSKGLMLTASIFIARFLGKTEYGELGMIRSTVNMFTVFASFGLGLTATKYIAELRIKDKNKTGKIIGLTSLFAGGTGFVIAVVILILAPFLAKKVINAPYLINEIRLGAIILFFSALNGAQTGILAGFEAFKTIARNNLLTGILAFPIQIGFTILLGLNGAVVGFGFNFLILWLINYISVRKEARKNGINIQLKNSLNQYSVLYKFSIPALLSGLLVNPVLWSCNAMLVNQVNGYHEMAIFDVASQWRNSILFIPSILSQIVLPLLANSNNNQNKFNSILKVNITINFIISLLIAIFVSLFSESILSTYGKGFVEGKSVFIIMVLSSILISINSVIGQAIASKGKMWIGFIINIIWATSLLSFTHFFLQNGYGALGLAYSVLISYVIHTVIVTIFTTKYLSKI